jgi:hypothetical protein
MLRLRLRLRKEEIGNRNLKLETGNWILDTQYTLTEWDNKPLI